ARGAARGRLGSGHGIPVAARARRRPPGRRGRLAARSRAAPDRAPVRLDPRRALRSLAGRRRVLALPREPPPAAAARDEPDRAPSAARRAERRPRRLRRGRRRAPHALLPRELPPRPSARPGRDRPARGPRGALRPRRALARAALLARVARGRVLL